MEYYRIRNIPTGQTREQAMNLMVSLLESRINQNMDAMDAARWMRQEFGLDIDWHETSYALEKMVGRGTATYNHHQRKCDGFTVYRIHTRKMV